MLSKLDSESAASIRHLIRTVRGHGLFLEEGPTAGEPIFHARVSVQHANGLWERAVRALGPTLPLEVARKSPDDHISPLYFAALGCRTMREAMQLTVRYWRYATHAFAATARPIGKTIQLRFELPRHAPLGARLGAEYLLADLARTSRELAGGAWQASELVLGHRPRVSLAVWEATCGVPVRVDPEAPGLVMPMAALDEPIRATLPSPVCRFVRELLDWVAPPSGVATTIAERVVEAVRRDRGALTASIDEVARALAMSTRTLHRRLAAEGTTFERALDDIRREEAIQRTLEDRCQLKAIGAALGFADPSGFRRAFKRWTGLTPQQFRQSHRSSM
jgi:AraC-like DNA-binding protein